MAKFAQTEQFENTPNRNVSIVIQKMIRNSISVCKSIRLHLINPVSQFQSTLDLFFRFLPCPLFLFVAFFLLVSPPSPFYMYSGAYYTRPQSCPNVPVKPQLPEHDSSKPFQSSSHTDRTVLSPSNQIHIWQPVVQTPYTEFDFEAIECSDTLYSRGNTPYSSGHIDVFRIPLCFFPFSGIQSARLYP